MSIGAKIAAGVAALIALGLIALALINHFETAGENKIIAADDKAVIQQTTQDNALNDAIVPKVQQTQSSAQAEVNATKELINAVPPSSAPGAPDLDPVFLPVIDSVQRLLAPYRGPPAP